MKRKRKMDISFVLPNNIHQEISTEERLALLEVAYLAIAADGKLVGEELDAFSQAMSLLYNPGARLDDIKAAVDHFIARFESGGDSVVLSELAAALTRPHIRNLAYKLAYAMAMSDFDTNNREFEYDQHLRRALNLTDEEAESLIDTVIDAVQPF